MDPRAIPWVLWPGTTGARPGRGAELWTLAITGRPRTKGSLEPVHIRTGSGKCRVSLKDNERSVAWKKQMIAGMRSGIEGQRYHGPVIVDAVFAFEREAAAHADAPWPTAISYGDEDKLRRNLLDALVQAGVLADDALCLGGETVKTFADTGPGGVVFTVWEAV